MRVVMPESLDEALAHLAKLGDHAVPIAGGTDLLVNWPAQRVDDRRTFIDLSRLDALKSITWTDEALVLGALTTYWDVIQDDRARTEFPLLLGAARQVGSVQIQTRGTWAGNIINASPAADGVPVLMAYGAKLTLGSTSGRNEIPLDDFYLDYKKMQRTPEQLVESIAIPRSTYDVQFFEKVGSRAAQTIAKVGLAVTHSTAGWRVVAASVAPVIKRCSAIEALLESGTTINSPADFTDAIAADVHPIDDMRSTAKYRQAVLARVLYFELKNRVAFVK